MRRFTNLVLSAFTLLMAGKALAQSPISYGSNQAAGSYYSIRGFRMYCEIYGKGKPLLMIHGNGGSINAFSQNVPYFSAHYMVILADSRAHGRSADPGDSLSFEMMSDDFSALLDALHIDSTYVIGWSDGGINALLLAIRHPDKVIKLASTGANLWPDSTGLVPSYWKDEQKHYLEQKDKSGRTPRQKNDYKIFLLDWLQPNIQLKALHAIKCPAFIISGDHDLIPLQHTVQIYQNIAKAQLWIVPDSGHPTLIEHRDEFNKLVDDFFLKPFHTH